MTSAATQSARPGMVRTVFADWGSAQKAAWAMSDAFNRPMFFGPQRDGNHFGAWEVAEDAAPDWGRFFYEVSAEGGTWNHAEGKRERMFSDRGETKRAKKAGG